MNSVKKEIRSRIDAFANELSELVALAALESVEEALGGMSRRKPGRPAASSASVRRTKKKRSKRGGRVRRSSEDIEKLAADILAHVRTNPGQRVEQIATDLALDTSDMKRPIGLMMEAKKLRTEGQRRGTKYFAGSGRSTKVTSKKTAKPKKPAGKKPASPQKKASSRKKKQPGNRKVAS